MQLLHKAIDRGAAVEELDRLIDLMERMRGIEALNAFTHAMVEFKKNPPTIQKNRTANVSSKRADAGEPKYAYQYANLADVCNAIVQQLATLGISHDHSFIQSGDKLTVTTTLTHQLGHSKSASLTSGFDMSGGKNSLQGLGSAVSYLERYTLLAVCGLALDDGQDDDGASGITQTDRAELRAEARNLRQRHSPAEVASRNQSAPASDELLKEARAKADKGHKEFGLYWRALNDQHRAQLLGELDNLTERANAATAQGEAK